MKFSCHHCSSVLEAAEEHRGLRSPCPQCGAMVQAPSVARAVALPEMGRVVQGVGSEGGSGAENGRETGAAAGAVRATEGARAEAAGWLDWACEGCGVRLQAPLALAGQRGPCPHCRAETGPGGAAGVSEAEAAKAGGSATAVGSANAVESAWAGDGDGQDGALGPRETGQENPFLAEWAEEELPTMGRRGSGDRGGRSGVAPEPLIGLGPAGGGGGRNVSEREGVGREGVGRGTGEGEGVGRILGGRPSTERAEIGQPLPGERRQRSSGRGPRGGRGSGVGGAERNEAARADAAEPKPRSGWLAVGLLLTALGVSFALAWGLRERPDAQHLDFVATATLETLVPPPAGPDEATRAQLEAGKQAQSVLQTILDDAGHDPQAAEPSLAVLQAVLRGSSWEERRDQLVFEDARWESLAREVLARSLPLKVRELDSRWRLADGRQEQYWLVQEVPPGYLAGVTRTQPRGQFLVAVVETERGWKVRGDALVAMQTRALDWLLDEVPPRGKAVAGPQRVQAVVRRWGVDPVGRPLVQLLTYASPSAAVGLLPWAGGELPEELRQPQGECRIASVEVAWRPVARQGDGKWATGENAGPAGGGEGAAGEQSVTGANSGEVAPVPLFEPKLPEERPGDAEPAAAGAAGEEGALADGSSSGDSDSAGDVRASASAEPAAAEGRASDLEPAANADPAPAAVKQELVITGIRLGPWGGPGEEIEPE